MALMDEFKEERESIKNGTLKQKAAYFWEYYRWHVIIPVAIIIAISCYIYQLATKTDDIVNGILLNTHNVEAQTLADQVASDFSKEMKIDTKKYSVSLNTALRYTANETNDVSNYESIQALIAWIGAGTVDFITSDEDTMTEFAYSEYFVDLREILSKDEIAKYEPYFLYIDLAVIEAKNNAADNNQTTETITIPDCRKPETMEEPVPVLIDIKQCEALSEIYSGAETLVLGITSNAPNKEMTLNFLNYMMK